MSQTRRQIIGAWGEQIAVNYLVKLGFFVLDRNFRTRRGEIDIVARKEDLLLFVEVKTRTGYIFSGEKSTNFHRISKLKNTAKIYLFTKQLDPSSFFIEFQQICLYLDEKTKRLKLKKYTLP